MLQRKCKLPWQSFPTIYVFIVIVLNALCLSEAVAKPRPVHLEKELKSALIIAEVEILEYKEGCLFVKFQESGEQSRCPGWCFKYSNDHAWKPSYFINQDENNDLTSGWPAVGAKVLVVADEENTVSLFAWRENGEYRFWSPAMTGSTAKPSPR